MKSCPLDIFRPPSPPAWLSLSSALEVCKSGMVIRSSRSLLSSQGSPPPATGLSTAAASITHSLTHSSIRGASPRSSLVVTQRTFEALLALWSSLALLFLYLNPHRWSPCLFLFHFCLCKNHSALLSLFHFTSPARLFCPPPLLRGDIAGPHHSWLCPMAPTGPCLTPIL